MHQLIGFFSVRQNKPLFMHYGIKGHVKMLRSMFYLNMARSDDV